jgi:hypothetical protein
MIAGFMVEKPGAAVFVAGILNNRESEERSAAPRRTNATERARRMLLIFDVVVEIAKDLG